MSIHIVSNQPKCISGGEKKGEEVTYARNISPICPPALVSGALPNVPAKNRMTSSIGILIERAPAMLKIAKRGYEALNAHLRPNISDNGAQINGPTPNPLTPSVSPPS